MAPQYKPKTPRPVPVRYLSEMDEEIMKLPGTSQINTNTYVSLGLLAACFIGFWTVLNAVYSAKSDIGSRLDKLEFRMASVETRKETSESWTDRDMFKWAVHLQKDNPNIKVPEPDMHTAHSNPEP